MTQEDNLQKVLYRKWEEKRPKIGSTKHTQINEKTQINFNMNP